MQATNCTARLPYLSTSTWDMNVETKIDACEGTSLTLSDQCLELIGKGLAPLDPLARTRDQLNAILDDLVRVGDRASIERARKLSSKLAGIEPAVTMIGQVKAGKTSLVNAMAGVPGLLPSDVNPWTSVVTSLHLDPSNQAAQNKACFHFLDRKDWDRLVLGGGRIGELAQRAGALSELERVTEQVAALREKSRLRLGNKFELLLGQEHDYGYFDKDLIERYVCLGDDFEEDTETSKSQGRFADITKSAEIYMHNPATPTKLCIRDTPGVNDTFLVREQITMKAIRGSQICVMVLAAHQALSTVDLALIRLISNVKSRDVVIFVNRIDELADPTNQVPEIRDSITATLKAHQGPEDAQIIFGSAHWANLLLEGRLSDLSEESASALLNYTRTEYANLPSGLTEQEIVWHLSGLAPLHTALAKRIAEGCGEAAFSAVTRNTRNLLNGIKVALDTAVQTKDGTPKAKVDCAATEQEFATIVAESTSSLDDGLNRLHGSFVDRIERVHESFLDRATESLIQHLETSGEGTVWNYDPTGLRMLLRSSYRTFAKRSKDLIKTVFAATAEDSSEFFERTFSLPQNSYDMEAPEVFAAPEPVILGKTIALDLQSSWWSSWWQKKSSATSQTQKFTELIAAETAPILHALREEYAVTIRNEATTLLADFLTEQRQVLENLTRSEDAPINADQSNRRLSKRQAQATLVDQSLTKLEALVDKTGA